MDIADTGVERVAQPAEFALGIGQEAIEHRDLDGNGAELPGDGDPGAAPDKDGGKIEHQIHHSSGESGRDDPLWGEP